MTNKYNYLIIEAYTNVYGEKYRDIITNRINSSMIYIYDDPIFIEDHIKFLRHCKRNMYRMQLLTKLGINVKDEYKTNYVNSLPANYQNIIRILIGKNQFKDINNAPIYNFTKNYNIEEKIDIINLFLKEKITVKNYDEFKKTIKYSQILYVVKKLTKLYQEQIKDYEEFKNSFKKELDIVKKYRENNNNLCHKKMIDVIKEIYPLLPINLQNRLNDKSDNELIKIIYSDNNVIETPIFLFFNEANMKLLEKLKDGSIKARTIRSYQFDYLRKLGIQIPQIFVNDLANNLEEYFDFINKLKIMPNKDNMKKMDEISKRKALEYKKDMIMKNNSYVPIFEYILNNTLSSDKERTESIVFDTLYNHINCTSIFKNKDNKYIPGIFISKDCNSGYRSYTFIHEIGHAIGIDSDNLTAFKNMPDYLERNKYESKYRKYERFNETLVDIFALRALSYLEGNNIFIIEDKEVTNHDRININTPGILKQALIPLISNFRKEVIDFKLNANLYILINAIGSVNFEELIDIINKLDYLNDQKIYLETIDDDSSNINNEIKNELIRLNLLYKKIDKYNKEKKTL